jgi:hypothetical protein
VRRIAILGMLCLIETFVTTEENSHDDVRGSAHRESPTEAHVDSELITFSEQAMRSRTLFTMPRISYSFQMLLRLLCAITAFDQIDSEFANPSTQHCTLLN